MTMGSSDRRVRRKCPSPSWTLQESKSLQPISPGGRWDEMCLRLELLRQSVLNAHSKTLGEKQGLQSRTDFCMQEGIWHLISLPTAGSIKSIFFCSADRVKRE